MEGRKDGVLKPLEKVDDSQGCKGSIPLPSAFKIGDWNIRYNVCTGCLMVKIMLQILKPPYIAFSLLSYGVMVTSLILNQKTRSLCRFESY
jgi:hypothetical protein